MGRRHREDDSEEVVTIVNLFYNGSISIQVGRGVLRRADRARQAFYRRVKSGEKPGYPRFKSSRRWHTIELANVDASTLKDRGHYYAIRIKGLPEIRLRKGLTLPEDTPKALSITLRGRRLFVNLTYAIEQAALPRADAVVGVDMGVSDRLALSNGEHVGRRRKPNAKLRRAQRRLSTCRKDSHQWRKRRAVLAVPRQPFLPDASIDFAGLTPSLTVDSALHRYDNL